MASPRASDASGDGADTADLAPRSVRRWADSPRFSARLAIDAPLLAVCPCCVLALLVRLTSARIALSTPKRRLPSVIVATPQAARSSSHSPRCSFSCALGCHRHARARPARSAPGPQCARRADQRGSARDLRRLQHRHPGQPQGHDQSSAAECVVEAPGALTSQPTRAVALLPRSTGPSRTGPRSASASRSTNLRSSPRAFSSSAPCRPVQR